MTVGLGAFDIGPTKYTELNSIMLLHAKVSIREKEWRCKIALIKMAADCEEIRRPANCSRRGFIFTLLCQHVYMLFVKGEHIEWLSVINAVNVNEQFVISVICNNHHPK